jgi:hypothetical protein
MASACVTLHWEEGWLDRLMDMAMRYYCAAKINNFFGFVKDWGK